MRHGLKSSESGSHGARAGVTLTLWLVLIAPVWGQFQPGNLPAGNLPDDAEAMTDSGVLRRPPRELQRQLDHARRAIEREEYTEAVELLASLLEATSHHSRLTLGNDFLLDPQADDTARTSLRGATWDLLRQLPPAAHELYELRMGPEADDALRRALAARTPDRLRGVAARYLETRAGDEALMLLGRYHLDGGQPRAAARCFQQLAESQYATKRFGQQLSVLHAMALVQSGQLDSGGEILNAMRQGNPTIDTATGPRTLPEHAGPRQQLERTVGNLRTAAPRLARDWPLHRGSADRNAVTAEAGTPVPFPRWRVRVALVSPEEEQYLEMQQAMYLQAGQPAIPALAPLAVDNTILMRSTDRLIAIDFPTGKYVWEWPWEEELEAIEDDLDVTGAEEVNARSRLTEITQRIWDDAPYAQMASDGRYVFLLNGLDAATAVNPMQRARRGGLTQLAISNELVALDITTQGKFVWRVGGVSGMGEPELAGVFFTGVPVPDGDCLYVMGELRGEMVLFCLQRDTGKLEWSQQLAFVPTGSIAMDPLRRQIGAVPSLQDDILVCPTSTGAIVAVDLNTRSVLWGYQYPRQQPQRRRSLWGSANANIPRESRWLDASVTLANRSVIATPPEADLLICLDLDTGLQRWTRPRAADDEQTVWWFVAGIYQDQVITVGHRHVGAWKLSDGTAAWSDLITVPADAQPAGRGFLHEGRYYLPTTEPALLEIQLDTGEVVHHPTDQPLGNLIGYQDQLISQTATELCAFYQRDALADQVASRLSDTPQDAWALERQAQLMLADNQPAAAAESLRTALKQYPAGDLRRLPTERLLFDAILQQLRDDVGNTPLAEEAESLASDPQQQLQLLRLRSEGYLAANQRSAAARELFRMNGLAGDARTWRGVPEGAARQLTLGNHATTHEAHWLAARFDQLWQMANETERLELNAQATEILRTLDPPPSIASLERFNCIFQSFPVGLTATLQLAAQFDQRHDTLGSELLFRTAQMSQSTAIALLRGAQRSEQLELLARLGESHVQTQQWDSLRSVLRQLDAFHGGSIATTNPAPVTWQDFTAEAWRDRLQKELLQGQPSDWPAGRIVVDVHAGDTARQNVNDEPRRIRRMNGGGGIPWEVRVNRELQLTLSNPYGQDLASVRLQGEHFLFQHTVEVGQYGPMLAIATRHQLALMDTSVARGDPQDLLRWTIGMGEPGIGATRVMPQFSAVVDWPWGDRRIQVTTPQGEPFNSRLGPLLPQGICYASPSRIVCVNPLTGEPIWERPAKTKDLELFGDQRMLFVAETVPAFPVRRSAEQRDNADRRDDDDVRETDSSATTEDLAWESAEVYRIMDGELLGQRKIPPTRRRWATLGRHVLYWETGDAGQSYQVRCRDAWSGDETWHITCPRGTKGCLVDNDELALLDPQGRFTIRDLISGQMRVDAQVEPSPTLMSIFVQRSDQQYLLLTDRQTPESAATTERLGPASRGYDQLLYGHVEAFARSDGRRLWQVPAFIDQFAPLPNAANEIPLLVMARSKQTTTRANRRNVEVIVLDTRDGRLVWEGSRPMTGRRDMRMTGQPERGRAQLALSDGETVVDFQFTDEPRPPAPPAQTGRAASRIAQTSSLKSVTGAVLRAFGRTLQPLQGDPDEAQDDPFPADADEAPGSQE